MGRVESISIVIVGILGLLLPLVRIGGRPLPDLSQD